MASPRTAEALSPEVGARRPRWLGWVAAARHADKSAFTSLHDHFCGMVHGIVLSKVPASDAPDLVQDIFIIALQKLTTLEDDAAFGGWLAQVTRARIARFLRDRPRHDPLPDEVALAAPDASGAPDARKVLAALQALPEAYSETLAMRLVEGMTGPEIAEATGLTPGSVRVNLHRGMKLLQEKLGIVPSGKGGPSDE
jgi:RNA polymerase sigma-70 factor (ECF subfamily)